MALLDVRSSESEQDGVAQIQREQVQLAQNVQSSSTIDSILADSAVAGYGYRVNDQGRRWVQQSLKARPLANSRLVSVTFTSRNPALSVDAINAAINSATPSANQSWPNASVFMGAVLPPPRKGFFGTITGMAVGMLAAFAVQRWGKNLRSNRAPVVR
jgi:hypothetical protein